MRVEDIEYDGERFSDHNLRIAYITTSPDSELDVANVLDVQKVKSANSDQYYQVNTQYEDVFQINIEVIKAICDPNAIEFSDIEMNRIERWLNRKQYHQLKFVFENEEFIDAMYEGTFTTVHPVSVGDKVVGFMLTFQSNSPYAYMDAVTQRFIFNGEKDTDTDTGTSETEPGKITQGGTAIEDSRVDSDNIWTVYDKSQDEGWTYVIMAIKCLEDGDLELKNSRDHHTTIVKNCKKNEIIRFSGETKVIMSSLGNEHKKLCNDFNYCFPRLINTYYLTRNDFTCSIKAEAVLRYNPKMKIGGFVI